MEKEKVTIYQLVWYFTIFSIIGLFVETAYCYLSTGVIESRKGLIWGPFCPIYGLGACVIIGLLNKYQKNWLKLLFLGTILGGVLEYTLSFMLEAVYGMRFWEYSYITQNLNGRICILYSIFWGILTVFVIKGVKPFIDKWIEKIPEKINKIIISGILVFFVIDAFCTVWAITAYENRARSKLVENAEYEIITEEIKQIEEKFFSDETMKETFPNLRIMQDGKEIFVRDII